MELTFTVRNVLLGATLLGVVGGVMGCFALLRRQSLLGDALAHAALPGVCLAYLLTQSKSSLPIFFGALASGLVGAVLVQGMVRFSRVKEDSALGIILSVFFGFGIVLLTYIQKLPFGNQSGLDSYLFGQAATLMPEDVRLMAVLGGIVLGAVALFYKELKVLCFDPEFGESVGIATRRVEFVLALLLVVVVVVGLRTVGVVLMVATLVTPAAAARQWTERLGVMLLLAAAIGGTSGAAGALLSASVDRLPTGPVIVLASSSLLLVSLAFAPGRGLLWAHLERRRVTRRVRRENLLKDLYRWGESHGDFETPVPWPFVMGFRGQSGGQLSRLAGHLARLGLLERGSSGIRLTSKGFAEAAGVVRKHRLWEVYLTHRLELASDHVHRDAEAMEHALSEEAVADLEARLGYPEVDPHGRRIPPRRPAA
jgi:manganese/zinc/iron transport system permease protein